jgi:hypothetical protein
MYVPTYEGAAENTFVQFTGPLPFMIVLRGAYPEM